MSDYLNIRGKRLVALALSDLETQQELNYRSVLDAQRDSFYDSNVEVETVTPIELIDEIPLDNIDYNIYDNYQPENTSTEPPTANCHNKSLSSPPGDPLPSKDAVSKQTRPRLVDYPVDTDTEDFSSASDDDYQPPPEKEYSDISDLSDFDLEEPSVSKLTRKRKLNTSNWKVNETKRLRSQCQPYKNKKKDCEAKAPKPVDCTRCRFQCTNYFTEEDRTALCKTYWAFADYNRQKDFIIKYVLVAAPKRRKELSSSGENMRTVSKVYYLENARGKHRVCANFFEKTLSISNGPINTAIQGAGSTGCFSGSDKRGRKAPGNKSSDTDVALVREHIESFPTMESHYVRKSTKKLYLESGLSILKMYELYESFCSERNTRPLKQCTYRRIFCNNYNISFFKPKKDLCATCSKYNTASPAEKSAMEVNYSLHLIRKNECQQAKAKDKERASEDQTFVTATFDLQSVLQMPYSDVSLFYYSRKICVYNLTIYLSSGEAHCYTWNELNGKRGSNEIGSILYTFLESLPDTVTTISLFCDTCGGQNRNQQVAAILLYAVGKITHLKQIELKFLESGHSQMECDSMHSAIESAKKYKTAYTMTDWINIFRAARSKRGQNKENGEYIVHYLKYSDFYDLQYLASCTVKNRNKDRDGNKISWLKIKSIKVTKEAPGTLFCRYDHSSEYKEVNIAGRGRRKTNNSTTLKPAYSGVLPITTVKKADLMKLVNAGHIPEELHPWYRSLPTIQTNGPERLPEPNASESEPDSDE